MIVDLQKVIFIGPRSSRPSFYLDMQEFGAVEFISSPSHVNGDKGAKERQLVAIDSAQSQSAIEMLVQSLRILRDFTPKKGQCEAEPISPENQETVLLERAMASALAIQKAKKEIDELDKLIANSRDERKVAEPFGSFHMVTLTALAKRTDRHPQFWFCPIHKLPDQIPDQMIEIKKTPEGFAGMSLANGALAPDNFQPVNLLRSIDEIDEQRSEFQRKRDLLLEQMQLIHQSSELMERGLEGLIDQLARQRAEKSAHSLLDDRLFIASAFVAKDRLCALDALIQPTPVYMQLASMEMGESAPTHMVNRGWGRVGQDLTEIYDTPSSGDRDPSSWILWSFALFFAMIIGDAGYGLLFLAGALFANSKVQKGANNLAKRAARLSCLLGVFCVGWGILSSAFFGLPLAAESPVRKLSLITYLAEKKAQYHYKCRDGVYAKWSAEYPQTANLANGAAILQIASKAKNHSMIEKFGDQIIMELALLIGVLHICTSLLRYCKRNWPAFGWSLFLAGAYALVPKLFGAIGLLQFCLGIPPHIAHYVGQILLISGGLLAIGAAFMQHGASGILEVMTVIQIGADVLSYLRIYALGLSGAIMANTINEGAAAVGIAFAPFVLVLGHSINLLLGLMGGVIHGLRLNFLEWYHYSFEGGGRPHKPLHYSRNLR